MNHLSKFSLHFPVLHRIVPQEHSSFFKTLSNASYSFNYLQRVSGSELESIPLVSQYHFDILEHRHNRCFFKFCLLNSKIRVMLGLFSINCLFS